MYFFSELLCWSFDFINFYLPCKGSLVCVYQLLFVIARPSVFIFFMKGLLMFYHGFYHIYWNQLLASCHVKSVFSSNCASKVLSWLSIFPVRNFRRKSSCLHHVLCTAFVMTFIGVTSILFVLCFFFCIVHFLVLSRLPYVLVLLALNFQVGILFFCKLVGGVAFSSWLPVFQLFVLSLSCFSMLPMLLCDSFCCVVYYSNLFYKIN